jgi:hypothetical protein
MHLSVDQPSTSTFTTQELARLAAYRGAVVAGLYTDWDGSAVTTDTRLLARVLRTQPGGAYAFTARERQHLLKLRKDVAAGAYAEDQPPPSNSPAKTATDDGGRPLAELE